LKRYYLFALTFYDLSICCHAGFIVNKGPSFQQAYTCYLHKLISGKVTAKS